MGSMCVSLHTRAYMCIHMRVGACVYACVCVVSTYVNCVIMCTRVHSVCLCVLTCVWPEPEARLAPFQALTGETLQLSLGMA